MRQHIHQRPIPRRGILILRYFCIICLHRNTENMGPPPRPPLRPVYRAPTSLHPRVSSCRDPPLWLRPISFSQQLLILSSALNHDIRRSHLCHWPGHTGVLLAGHVYGNGHRFDMRLGVWRCVYCSDELVGHRREGFGARRGERSPGINGVGLWD